MVQHDFKISGGLLMFKPIRNVLHTEKNVKVISPILKVIFFGKIQKFLIDPTDDSIILYLSSHVINKYFR